MKEITKMLHLNSHTSTEAAPIVEPIYQTSAFRSSSPHFYTRKSNPNSVSFESAMKILEDSKFAISTTCGMSAINLTLMLLNPGDTLVVNKHIYGCSFKWFKQYTEKNHMNMIVIDLSESSNIQLIPASTKMILFETPTNPFLKTINIESIRKYLREDCNNNDALIVVDNTWATPLFQKPLKCGADISLHSGTKYLCGHSDTMGGIILMDDEAIYQKVSDFRFYTGSILKPFDAWLLNRSLQTLELRMLHHQASTLNILEFIKDSGYFSKVYYPDIDVKQLTGYGTLIFAELAPPFIGLYTEIAKGLKIFNTGTGMAAVTSMIAQPYNGSHASMNEDEKKKMGLTENLVRFSFGLEDQDDLKKDISNVMAKIHVSMV